MFIVNPTLPAWTVILLPLATSAITGIFEVSNTKHPWGKVFNALLAALFFLLGATIIFILSGSLSENFGFDALIYLSLLGILMQSPPCKALYETSLSVIPSPLTVIFFLLDKSFEPEETEEKPVAFLTRMDDVHTASTNPEIPRFPPEVL